LRLLSSWRDPDVKTQKELPPWYENALI